MNNLAYLLILEATYNIKTNGLENIPRSLFYRDWWRYCPHINRTEKYWSDPCPDCTKSFCD